MADNLALIRARALRQEINTKTGIADTTVTDGVKRLLNNSGNELVIPHEAGTLLDAPPEPRIIGQTFEKLVDYGDFVLQETNKISYLTKQLEYLESTGNKEYINTNFIPDVQTDSFKIKFKITDTASTTDSWRGVIGTQSKGNGSGSNFGVWYTPWNKLVLGTVYTNKIFEVTCSPFFDQTNLTEVDDYVTGNYKLGHKIMENSTVPLTLYYRNCPEDIIVSPGKGQSNSYGKCRIYYLQIFRNDVLIKHYIPIHEGYVYEGSFYKTAVGMHEVIDDVLYLNDGTGAFIEGPYI